MSTNATEQAAKRETTIEADPNLPTIRIIRDFDAPPDKVFRAWVDPELVDQWLGPEEHRDEDRPVERSHRRELSLCSAAGRRGGGRLLRVLP